MNQSAKELLCELVGHDLLYTPVEGAPLILTPLFCTFCGQVFTVLERTLMTNGTNAATPVVMGVSKFTITYPIHIRKS